MEISDGEKLILIMLCELHEKLGIKGETNTGLIKEAIYSGNLWGLKWGMPGLFHGHEASPDVVKETVDILDMWRYIESSYARLSAEDKARSSRKPISAAMFSFTDSTATMKQNISASPDL